MSKKELKNKQSKPEARLERELKTKEELCVKEYDLELTQSEARQDRFMFLLILGHWPLAVFLIPLGYGTQAFGFLFGTLLCLIAALAYLFLQRTMLLKIINGQVLIAFSSIFIAEQLGRIEMHFHVFGVLAFLLLYRHWKPIVFAGLMIAVQHTVFNYCQIYNVKLFGIPLMVFNYGYGLEIIFWHAFWVVFECVILVYIGRKNQEQLDRDRTHVEKQTALSQELMREREKALNNFLKVSDQGIFSFGKNLKMEWGYSQECEKLLGLKNLEGRSIPELFFKNTASDLQKQKEFQEIFALIFENNINSEEVFALLDKELLLGEKEIALGYIRLDSHRIMCIMTNITEKKKLHTRLKREQELHEHILKVVSNNKFFTSFLKETEKLFGDLDSILSTEGESISIEEVQNLILSIHDFKANSGFFGFSETAEKAHALESFLIAKRSSGAFFGSEEFEIQCIELKKKFEDNVNFIRNNISEEWVQGSDSLSISTERILAIHEKFSRKYPKDKDLLEDLQSLCFIPAKEVFKRFVPMTRELMKKLGKQIKPLSIEGGETLVPKEIFFSLASVLSHLIRNMVYHGIESPAERLAKNKQEKGEISIEIKNETQNAKEGCYHILFRDDGRGIDFEKVKKSARENGFLNGKAPTEKELTELLFHTHLSTASQVGQISGRGAGLMCVYKEVVDRLGGDISIQTQKDIGTSFLIKIPCAKALKKQGALKNSSLLVLK